MFCYEFTMIKKDCDVRIVVEIELDDRVEFFHNRKFTTYLKVGEVWLIDSVMNVDESESKIIIYQLEKENWNYILNSLIPYEIKYEDPKGEKYFAFL